MTLLIATDIDGTLLRSDGTVSERTRAAIAATEEAGHVFVLVTGRPPRWLAPVTEQVDHRGLAICANGGIVLDLHTDTVIEARTFPDDLAREVLEALRDHDPRLTFGVEWADGFAHEASYPRGVRRSELARGAAQTVPTDELFARPVVKLLGRVDGGSSDEEIMAVADLIGDRATVTWGSTGLVEISAPGVTKATGLRDYAEGHGLDASHTTAFGDMPNDLPMLEWAGHGVAVANAHALVLEAADEVTASNEEDGVAQVVERLLA